MIWFKAYNLTNFPRFSINFNLLHNTSNTTWNTHCRHLLMHVHTSHRPYGYPFFTLCSWQQAHMNPWCNLWHFCCHYVGCWFPSGVKITTRVSFKHVQLFPSMSRHYVHQRWHLHLSQCCHYWPNTSGFTFFHLLPPKDLSLPMRFKPKNKAITIDTLSINSSP